MASSMRLFAHLSKSFSTYLPRYGTIYASKLPSTLCKGRFLSSGQTLKCLDNVDERIHVLEKVGYSTDEAQSYLNKTNTLKNMRLETLEEKIQYFKDELKLDDSQVKKVMKHDRAVLCSIARLSQTVEVLVHDLKCDSLELTNLITSFPDVFYISPELLHSNIGALPGKFEISFELFRENVLRKPLVLGFSVEWINSHIEDLKKMKLNLDQIIIIFLVKGIVITNLTKLKECLEVLKDNSELKDSELQKLMIDKPRKMAYLSAPEHVAENCKYLLSEFGDSKDLIKKMVMRDPQIFSFKTSTLKSKVGYIINEMGLSIEDLVKESTGLGYKLERIKERHKFLILHGNKENKFPKLLPMLIPGDKLFLERFTKGATLEQFTEFKNKLSHKQ